jgi:hypothetical protein
MEEFIGYVDPELALYLKYDGFDYSSFIGNEYAPVGIIVLTPNEEGVYVAIL